MKDLSTLTPEEQKATLARREYHRQWRKKNPDKVEQTTKKFYLKQALKMQEQQEEQTKKETV